MNELIISDMLRFNFPAFQITLVFQINAQCPISAHTQLSLSALCSVNKLWWAKFIEFIVVCPVPNILQKISALVCLFGTAEYCIIKENLICDSSFNLFAFNLHLEQAPKLLLCSHDTLVFCIKCLLSSQYQAKGNHAIVNF